MIDAKKLSKKILTEDNPLSHDTWKLLKNYRDAVWNLELASSRYAIPLKSNTVAALRNFWIPFTWQAQMSAVRNLIITPEALSEATKC